MKIVLDANAVISGFLLENSVSSRAFAKVIDEHILLTSLPILEEIKGKIPNKKFDKYLDLDTRIAFVAKFELQAKLITVKHKVSICRDPKDNKYLELALSGRVDCIITGDKDLLVLNPFENILIISAKEFLGKYS